LLLERASPLCHATSFGDPQFKAVARQIAALALASGSCD
jgi:hypothetical protein